MADTFDHSTHNAWRRWTITRYVIRSAYRLGIISGSSRVYSADCCGCLTRVHRRGPRPYILGRPRAWWECLLRRRHIRGEAIDFGFCGKCLPWPCCGAITKAHAEGCADS